MNKNINMLRKIINTFNPNFRFCTWRPPSKDTVCQTEGDSGSQNNEVKPEIVPSEKTEIIQPVCTQQRTVCPWITPEKATAEHTSAPKHPVWRSLTLFVCIPIIVLISANVLLLGNDNEDERPTFVPYEYMYIRRKRFPWGDGNKTLFHNPKKNALPDGYEE